VSKETPESSSPEHPTQHDPELAPTKEQTLIRGRYWIEKELGRGGIGIVYLARDVQLHNRPVVMKVLQEVREEEWIQKKFRQEMEALARIEHPGVVGIFDAGKCR
jgi:serine/threonine-protein kinase